jgi:hypothetical protein
MGIRGNGKTGQRGMGKRGHCSSDEPARLAPVKALIFWLSREYSVTILSLAGLPLLTGNTDEI